MRSTTATADSHQISVIRRPGLSFGCSRPVQGHSPCLSNHGSCSVGSHRKDQAICLESPRSRFKRRRSQRRFLTGLFIFEKGSRKRRRRGSANTLIIKDIQIRREDHNGTRIAFLRPVCLPSRSRETERKRNLVQSGQWNNFASFDDLLRL